MTGPRLLILGNMPSVMSLAAQQYYANPRNAFWRITGEIFGFDAGAPYETRTAALRARGVAVWDVLRSCRRKGSLDSAIEPDSMVANDFGTLVRRVPDDRAGGLQRRGRGEELRAVGPPGIGRLGASAAIDESGPNHALRGETTCLAGSGRRGRAAVRPRPSRLDLRAERQQCASSNGLPTNWIDSGTPSASSPTARQPPAGRSR